MTNPSRFTADARSEISRYLKKKQLRTATLIAGMYVQARLATLIRRNLQIDDKAGKKSFRHLFGNQTLGQLLTLSYKARMISNSEKTFLQKFLELRNDVAHDFEMWDPLDKETRDAIDYWCHKIMDFMSATDDRKDPVREESNPQKPQYLSFPRNQTSQAMVATT
jgi:hypothetical protein